MIVIKENFRYLTGTKKKHRSRTHIYIYFEDMIKKTSFNPYFNLFSIYP
jgi:hypothetical protein